MRRVESDSQQPALRSSLLRCQGHVVPLLRRVNTAHRGSRSTQIRTSGSSKTSCIRKYSDIATLWIAKSFCPT